MATEYQIKRTEHTLREYRKKYLTKSQNREQDEAGTRLMINHFLTDVLGYIELDEIKTEYRIRGEYADYVIQLGRKKQFVVEAKAIQLDLNEHHLRQSLSYAANEGIDWIMLFNGQSLQLFRVLFGKPISYKKVFDFDLLNLSLMKTAAETLVNLTKTAVSKGDLEEYWIRFEALTPKSLVDAIYTDDVIRAIRTKLKRRCGIYFDKMDVLDAVHNLVTKECIATKPNKLK